MSPDPTIRSVQELAGQIRAGQVSATETVQACLKRISQVDPELGAFLHVDPQGALETAGKIDEELKSGRSPGPLAGVPVALKDNISTSGIPTTCASRILEGYVPPFDATVVRRLKEAGAVILGKTNLDEFAMGNSTRSSAFRVTKNPWNTSRIPGGSSGGSAVAVSAGMVPVALGSDTGGSVRQPAALCGVSGIKPTWGAVSRYGLVAYSSSLDQIGCLGTSAMDLALVLSVISGPDPLDATSGVGGSSDLLNSLAAVDVKKLRVGWVPELLESAVEPGIASLLRSAVEQLRSEVASVAVSNWPFADYLTSVYYIIAMSEASSNLSRFDGVRYTQRCEVANEGLNGLYTHTRGTFFGDEVRRRILLGTHSLSSGYFQQYYGQASRVRRLVQNALIEELKRVDVIIIPTTASTAEPIDGHVDPVKSYCSDQFTVAANLAGLPAMSVPCGFSVDGMPVGMQLIAGPHREDILLSLANHWQKMTDWHQRRPGP